MNGLNNGNEMTKTTLGLMSSSSEMSAEPIDAMKKEAANSEEEPEEEVQRMAEVASPILARLSVAKSGGIMTGVPHTISPVSTTTTTTTTASKKANILFPKSVRMRSNVNGLNNGTKTTETALGLTSSSSETSAEPLNFAEKEAAISEEEPEEEVPRLAELTSPILARLPLPQHGGIMTVVPYTTISPIPITTTTTTTTSQKANIHFPKSVKMRSNMNGLNNGTERTDTALSFMTSSSEVSAETADATEKESANSGGEPEEEVARMAELTSPILARLPVSVPQPGGRVTGGPHTTISPISITATTTTTLSPSSKTASSSGKFVNIWTDLKLYFLPLS